MGSKLSRLERIPILHHKHENHATDIQPSQDFRLINCSRRVPYSEELKKAKGESQAAKIDNITLTKKGVIPW